MYFLSLVAANLSTLNYLYFESNSNPPLFISMVQSKLNGATRNSLSLQVFYDGVIFMLYFYCSKYLNFLTSLIICVYLILKQLFLKRGMLRLLCVFAMWDAVIIK